MSTYELFAAKIQIPPRYFSRSIYSTEFVDSVLFFALHNMVSVAKRQNFNCHNHLRDVISQLNSYTTVACDLSPFCGCISVPFYRVWCVRDLFIRNTICGVYNPYIVCSIYDYFFLLFQFLFFSPLSQYVFAMWLIFFGWRNFACQLPNFHDRF